MAGAFADRIKETSTSSGTGNFTLAGPVAGYESFFDVFGSNRQFCYCIEEVDASGVPTGDWEVGASYLTSSTAFVRDANTSVQANSLNTTALISFASATTKNVFNPMTGLSARKSTHGFDLQYGMP